MKKKSNKKESETSGLLIPGGLLVGIGLGLITGQVAAYTLIGLGAGFIAMWFFRKK
ncbi:hypothetical protein ACFLZZ_00480 [Nanoarchaeota archaeon]